ncbi:MAG: polysaccharide deacetylase family protein [Acidobacteria bacterium]|nr:polysaccharide deacetylase family protein [Acidobacteriota bacterium]
MSSWRCLLHWLRAAGLWGIGGLWIAKRQLRRNGSIVVLALHRVLNDAELPRTNSLPGIVMRRETFDRLVAYIADRFRVVRTDDSFSGDRAHVRVALTFDDGWRDTGENALPVAGSHAVPFTVFVCPGLVGKNSPFWPERVVGMMKRTKGDAEAAIAKLKLCRPRDRELAIAELGANTEGEVESGGCDGTLSWQQLSLMRDRGVSIASHGCNHEILTVLEERGVEEEVQSSKRILEERLNQPCRVFAYPNGNHSPQVRRVLAAAGYERAFTTERGAWSRFSDPLAIPRINVYEGNVTGPNGRFSPLLFEYTVFWRSWRAGC